MLFLKLRTCLNNNEPQARQKVAEAEHIRRRHRVISARTVFSGKKTKGYSPRVSTGAKSRKPQH